MTWRIQVADKLDPSGLERLRQQSTVIESPELNSIGDMDALIVRSGTRVTGEVLKRGQPRLKVVGRAGVGVDNIDLETASDLNITVVNVPGAATNAVAEHALALMFALARNLPAADATMKAGRWDKKLLKGQELHGRTLGVIGMGRIGSLLTSKAKALGLKVLGYDPPIPNPKIEAAGAISTPLAELMSLSDFVSLHVPLKMDTRLMIGSEDMNRMKPTAYLISTARGGVVDENALLNALNEDKLAGAALDVFEQEPPGSTPLVEHPKLIATPHLGSQTVEAQQRAAVDIAEEVLAALQGEELRWRVR
ncbi:MAG: hydroxyacid dehydrogenase [Anaerolineales bacterium]